MSLKPVESIAAQVALAEGKVFGLVKVYIDLGKIEQKSKQALQDSPVVQTAIDLNRKIVIEEAREFIKPFFLQRRIQLHSEINFWKNALLAATRKDTPNFFECSSLWHSLFYSVIVASMYGVYICMDVWEGLQEFHQFIFKERNEDLYALQNENKNFISMPVIGVQLCGIDPVTFGPVPRFVALDEQNEKNEKNEKDEKEIFMDIDRQIDAGLRELKGDISQVSLDEFIAGPGEGKKALTLPELSAPGKQEVDEDDDVEMEGMFPETYMNELTNC